MDLPSLRRLTTAADPLVSGWRYFMVVFTSSRQGIMHLYERQVILVSLQENDLPLSEALSSAA
jgi:hypothetical protein